METKLKIDSEHVFRVERLMESCEDDDALARDVLKDFRVSAPIHLSRIAAALAASDTATVCLEGHSLKGSSSTIGAEVLASVCARLEYAGAGEDLSDVPVLLAEAELRFYNLSSALSAYLENQ